MTTTHNDKLLILDFDGVINRWNLWRENDADFTDVKLIEVPRFNGWVSDFYICPELISHINNLSKTVDIMWATARNESPEFHEHLGFHKFPFINTDSQFLTGDSGDWFVESKTRNVLETIKTWRALHGENTRVTWVDDDLKDSPLSLTYASEAHITTISPSLDYGITQNIWGDIVQSLGCGNGVEAGGDSKAVSD